MQCVIVVFPDHTHLLSDKFDNTRARKSQDLSHGRAMCCKYHNIM